MERQNEEADHGSAAGAGESRRREVEEGCTKLQRRWGAAAAVAAVAEVPAHPKDRGNPEIPRSLVDDVAALLVAVRSGVELGDELRHAADNHGLGEAPEEDHEGGVDPLGVCVRLDAVADEEDHRGGEGG